MRYRTMLLLIGFSPLLVGIASYVVGERIEVVALRTTDSQGHAHDTKLWIVDHEGRPWIRAVRPSLSWVERLRVNPRVELVRNGQTTAFTAAIVETPEAKHAVDAAIAAKYGWIDSWYEFLVRHDTIPIRLDPDGAPPGA
jgi:hypothetical protein